MLVQTSQNDLDYRECNYNCSFIPINSDIRSILKFCNGNFCKFIQTSSCSASYSIYRFTEYLLHDNTRNYVMSKKHQMYPLILFSRYTYSGWLQTRQSCTGIWLQFFRREILSFFWRKVSLLSKFKLPGSVFASSIMWKTKWKRT